MTDPSEGQDSPAPAGRPGPESPVDLTPPSVLEPRRQRIVITPRAILLDWPAMAAGESVVELAINGGSPPAAEMFLPALPGLLRELDAWHQQGAAVLAPWSLRVSPEGAITAWCTPGLGPTVDWPGPLRSITSHGPSADLFVLGLLVHRLSAGRWALSPAAAVMDAGVLGGEWPMGADATVIACLTPDAGRRVKTAGELAERVEQLVIAPESGLPPGTRMVVADESVTGWTKSRGRPDGDNEDAAAWDWTRDGVVAAVLDGVSGTGDGGGRWASHELRRRLKSCWRRRIHEPSEALAQAVKSMSGPPRDVDLTSSTVGVVVRVKGGRLDWASVGDCRVYLARPHPHGVSVGRLTPEQSALADALRAGEQPTLEDLGVVTNAVPRPDRGALVGSASLRAGDVVVLLSDGACRTGRDEAPTDQWQFAAVLEGLLGDGREIHPPLVVSQLCRRAEELGGEDNATALAISCGSATSGAPPGRARRWPSTVRQDPPPLVRDRRLTDGSA